MFPRGHKVGAEIARVTGRFSEELRGESAIDSTCDGTEIWGENVNHLSASERKKGRSGT